MPTSGPPPVSPGGPRSTLPVEATIEDLRSALRQTSSAVLQAPPGAGKTTIVPLRLLAEPWLDGRRIVMLEPRRLAARAAARRMADLLGEEVGRTVGYRTRDERHVGRDTRIEVVTEGILTRRLQRDPSLPGTGMVIFDEIHERNLQTDLALAFTLDARDALRPDLRILAMSATLDTDRVAEVIGRDQPAPVITQRRPYAPRRHPMASGRSTTVVDRRASPRRRRPRCSTRSSTTRATSSCSWPAPPTSAGSSRCSGAVAGPTTSTSERSSARCPSRSRIWRWPPRLPVAAGWSSPPTSPRPASRSRASGWSSTAARSAVLSTTRAAASPDCAPGSTRGPRPNSAPDAPGASSRGWPTASGPRWSRPLGDPHADPEIVSVDLTGFALELAVWGTSADDLTFLDPPPRRSLDVARSLLHDLGALDADGRVTDAGRSMSELPVHPRLARMVTAGADLGVGSIACSLAAMLEERDVLRGRPDELPTNIVDRLRLVDGTATDHPRLDRSALHLVRRRAGELARRAGIERSDRGSTDPMTAAGLALALAYPDRVAQARGNGRFRMRNGAGAWLPEGDALTGEPFLVVAELATDARAERGRADHRILMAAALDESDLELAAGDGVERITTLAWDPERDDLRVRTERRLGVIGAGVNRRPGRTGRRHRRGLARPRPGHPPRGARLVAFVPGAPDPPPVRTPRLRRQLARRLRRRAARFPRRVVGATTPRHDASLRSSSASTWAACCATSSVTTGSTSSTPSCPRRSPWPTDGAFPSTTAASSRPSPYGCRTSTARRRTRRWPTGRSPSSSTCSRPPVVRCRSPRIFPASGPAAGRRFARTWPVGTPSTTGRSTPRRRPARSARVGPGTQGLVATRSMSADMPACPAPSWIRASYERRTSMSHVRERVGE